MTSLNSANQQKFAAYFCSQNVNPDLGSWRKRDEKPAALKSDIDTTDSI